MYSKLLSIVLKGMEKNTRADLGLFVCVSTAHVFKGGISKSKIAKHSIFSFLKQSRARAAGGDLILNKLSWLMI